jgi:hypothetical protein
MTFDQTRLWKSTLGSNPKVESDARVVERLRNAYLLMRERIRPIVQQAHLDCTGLTIHDLSHLDAIWEMADLLIGDALTLNPIEAFVLGGAILLHDSALAIAAYPGGLDALKTTPEWARNADRVTLNDTHDASSIERLTIFNTLRELHASQAEKMLEISWTSPDRQEFYLLDDVELRSFYGQSIGRIAHSHHWDIDQVSRELLTDKGVYPGFPRTWTLNEVKIACVLRCSDAAQIDRRRAPTMEFGLAPPSGRSEQHWQFQHKLGFPSIRGGRLIYTSSRDFGKGEAEAWWLALDTCRMIDRELMDSNALLKEVGLSPLCAEGVEGVQRPRLFAHYVKTSNWVPVDAEVKVSDPVNLAKTLGGENLYGEGIAAPIREMLQNAIDATLIREKIEQQIGNRSYSPQIWLRLYRENSKIYISISDNGIGMNERILTGGLIDFGRSFWRMQLDSLSVTNKDWSPSGKFGIGFFSVFLIGSHVTVESRPYDRGLNETLTLEFSELGKRPIVYSGGRPDFSVEMSTRIRIEIDESILNRGIIRDISNDEMYNYGIYGFGHERARNIFSYCRWLTLSSHSKIHFIDEILDRSFVHPGNWKAIDSRTFLENCTASWGNSSIGEKDIDDFSSLISELIEDDLVVGRACIKIDSNLEGGHLRVGGLTYRHGGQRSTQYIPAYLGIIDGDVNIATRGGAELSVRPETISKWATDQGRLFSEANLSTISKIKVSQRIYRSSGDPKSLPFAMYKNELVTLDQVKAIIKSEDRIHIPFSWSDGGPCWLAIDDLGISYYNDPIDFPVLVIIPTGGEELFEDGDEELIDMYMPEKGDSFEAGALEYINWDENDIIPDLLGMPFEKMELVHDQFDIFAHGRSRHPQHVLTIKLK